jgi:hypothetical protein
MWGWPQAPVIAPLGLRIRNPCLWGILQEADADPSMFMLLKNQCRFIHVFCGTSLCTCVKTEDIIAIFGFASFRLGIGTKGHWKYCKKKGGLWFLS